MYFRFALTMKKLIKKAFGIFASAKNVKGRKSDGVEDTSPYKNWRIMDYGNPGAGIN